MNQGEAAEDVERFVLGLFGMTHQAPWQPHQSERVDSPTAKLRAEHDRILAVMKAVTRALDEGGQFADTDFWQRTVRFLQAFVDRYHHMKEEVVFFPRLEMRGVGPRGCRLAVIVGEHEQAKALLKSIAALVPTLPEVEGVEQDRFVTAMRKYCALVVQCVARENGVLFPLADRLLSAGDRHEILQRFALWDGPVAFDAQHKLSAMTDRTPAAPPSPVVATGPVQPPAA